MLKIWRGSWRDSNSRRRDVRNQAAAVKLGKVVRFYCWRLLVGPEVRPR